MAKVGVDDKVNTEEKQKGGNKISTFLKLPENIANDVEFSLCGKSTASVAPSALEEGKKSKVHLAGFNLKFSFLGEPFPDAQKAFHTEYAKQSLFWFRYWRNVPIVARGKQRAGGGHAKIHKREARRD